MLLDRLIARMRFSEALALVRKLEKQKGRKLKILDLGGAGFVPGKRLADHLRKRGHSVLVGDIAGAPDVILDMNRPLPFKDQSFDLVVSLAVVEHLDDWKTALSEMKRVGKAVVFTTPAPAARPVLEKMARFGLVSREQVEDHRHYLSSEEIETAGFQCYRFQGGLNQVGYMGIVIDNSPLVAVSLVLLLAVLMLLTSRMPPDDLLRHLVSYRHGYDWRTVFPYSSIPSFDLWIGFEVLAGYAHRLFNGNGLDWKLVQALNVLLNVTGLFLVTKKVKDINLRAFMVLLVTGVIWHRLMLGRPAEFMNGIMLVLWGLDDKLPRPAKAAAATITAPLYWLWWVYIVPLVMLDRIYLLGLAGGAAFWGIYGESAYFQFILHLARSIHDAPITMAENIGLFPSGLFILGFVFMAAGSRDKRPLAAMAWFALSNQMRYIMSILSVSLASLGDKDWSLKKGIYLCSLAMLVLFNRGGFSIHATGQEDLSLLEGRTVFCAHMASMYYLVYRIKDIRLAPSYNMYDDATEIVEIYRSLAKNRKQKEFRCDLVQKLDIDYVVDTWQFESIPECLELDAIRGPFRIWSLKTHSKRGVFKQPGR